MPFTLATAGDLATLTGSASALNADLIPTSDTSNFQTALVQIFGTFSGTVTFQGTNEDVPVNWVNLAVMNIATGAVAATANSAGLYYVPLTCKNFRVRCTSYTSGTIQTVTIFSYDEVPFIEAGNTIVSGSVSISGNPVLGTGSNPIGAIAVNTSATSALLQSRVVGAASGFAKAGAGRLYGWTFTNTNAAIRYLQVYNKASAGIPGTDTPVMTVAIPPNVNVDAQSAIGIANALGIAWAITTDAAGATIGAANDIVGTMFYA